MVKDLVPEWLAFHGGQCLISDDFLQPFQERFRFAGQAFVAADINCQFTKSRISPGDGPLSMWMGGHLTEAGMSVHCGWHDALGWDPTLHGKERVHRAQTFISAPRLQK